MGASYEATCIALRNYDAVDSSVLHSVQPKKIKQALVPDYHPEHWHRDIWSLSERDEGAVIEGQPDDLFLFRLNEKSGAGYLWDITELKKSGFVIVHDSRDINGQSEAIGGSVQRVITAQSESPATGEVLLALRRPWQKSGDAAEKLHLKYSICAARNKVYHELSDRNCMQHDSYGPKRSSSKWPRTWIRIQDQRASRLQLVMCTLPRDRCRLSRCPQNIFTSTLFSGRRHQIQMTELL